MRLFLQVAAISLLIGGVSAHADTFEYDLTFNLTGVASASATFTSPTLITTDTTVSATGTSTSGPVLSVDIFAMGDCPFTADSACFAINPAGQRLFLASLPTSTGTFEDVLGDGSVVITDISGSPNPVPEPSSFGLAATGVLGAIGALRRRVA